MKKTITISQFVDELIERINHKKDIDCCKEEIKQLALIAKKELGQKLIEVNWQEEL